METASENPDQEEALAKIEEGLGIDLTPAARVDRVLNKIERIIGDGEADLFKEADVPGQLKALGKVVKTLETNASGEKFQKDAFRNRIRIASSAK